MAGASLERWFGFTERRTDLATEVRAGVTTFMVMAYIIFVNPIVLGYAGVPGLEGKGLPFSPTLTVTCLTAGVLSIAMGLALNGALAGFKGFPTPGAATLPQALVQAPDFSTFGRLDFGVLARLGVVTAVLVTFSIMLSDFFDTMGTIIGVGGKGGFLDAHGRLPRSDRVLLVDSLGATLGGLANASSNTTYIESAAGVAEGGRTGLVPVVSGLLFLGAMWLSPLASVIPAQATAPALIVVGFFMMGIARDIPWDDYEEAIPAFMTMLVMPFTWSITNGIGAGLVSYAAIKLLRGRGAQLHWMVYVASVAFVVYFALPLVERALGR